ncbi:MAG: hypothetical protein KA319_03645 [Ferruginibacter sp.]|nr:hypothetical protein [Ferruginibacter sp.]
MKKLVLLFIISLVSFSASAQKKKKRNTTKRAAVTQVQTKPAAQPACVQTLIEKFSKEEKQEPRRSIYSYTYKGKTVYYVTAPCCDFFTDVYDESCNLIGHPDGGITGKGDMNMLDFNTLKTNEKLIWTDDRK